MPIHIHGLFHLQVCANTVLLLDLGSWVTVMTGWNLSQISEHTIFSTLVLVGV